MTERLHEQMLARGFDPAQADHLALTGPLVKLYLEREELLAELKTGSDALSERDSLTSEPDGS